MNRLVLSIFCTSFFFTGFAKAKTDIKTTKVCLRLASISEPKRVSPDSCYNQAREYLKQKKILVMKGSYQTYFSLSVDDKDQADCRHFLKSVFTSTQELELDEARELFKNDKAQSLDQSYYSYQKCADVARAIAESNSAAKPNPAVKSNTSR